MHVVFRQIPIAFALLAGALLLSNCRKEADPAAEARARATKLAAALNQAEEQMAAGQPVAAIATLENLRAAVPERMDVVEALARAREQAGQAQQAAELFEEAASHDASRNGLLVYAAGMFAGQGDHTSAVRAYHEYLKDYPQDAAAWKALAQELAALNQPAEALTAYLEALNRPSKHDPTAADSAAIGRWYLQLQRDAEAEAWLKDALLRRPEAATAAQARLGLLDLAMRQQKMADAEKLVTDLNAEAVGHAALEASPLASARSLVVAWRKNQDEQASNVAAAQALAASQAAAVKTVESPTPGSGPTTAPEAGATVATTAPVAAANVTTAVANTTVAVTAGNMTVVANNSAAGNGTAAASTAGSGNLTASSGLTAAGNATATVAGNTTVAPAAEVAGSASGATPSGNATAALNSATTVAPPADEAAAKAAPIFAEARKAAAEGRNTDAITGFWKGLDADDTNPDSWLGLAQAYFANKQFTQAGSVAQEAIRRAPDNPSYLVFYLKTVKEGQPATTYQTELDAAYKKFPDSADVTLALADYYRQQGDSPDAATVCNNYLRRAAADDPRRADIQAALDALPAP